jgi:hypothetical protein
MEHEKNKQRILSEAAALMGPQEVAGRLGVTAAEVLAWIEGTAIVPDGILTELSEILLSWSGKQKFR